MPNSEQAIPTMPVNPQSKTANSIPKLLVLVALVVIIGGLFLLLNQLNLLPFSRLFNPPSASPTPNVLYPQNYDPTGRNIFYTTLDSKGVAQRSAYGGAGIHYLGEETKFYKDNGELIRTVDGSNMAAHIVGVFTEWESIPGSDDKYMTLSNPLNVQYEKKQPLTLPKVRVGLSKEPDPKKPYTRLHVEELSSVIPVFKGEKVKTHFIGYIHELTAYQVDALIKPGDTLAAQLYMDFEKNTNSLDSNGNLKTSDLFIRRFNAVDQVHKESGISIK